MATIPTESELNELMTTQPVSEAPKNRQAFLDKKAPPGMPDPAPEVVERAKAIIKGAGKGALDASVVVEAPDAQETKLRFLAHLLGGVAYTKTYTLLGGAQVITFTTISAVLDGLLAQAAQLEAKELRKARYEDYLMLASILGIKTADGTTRPVYLTETMTPQVIRSAYQTWVASVNREQYLLLRDLSDKFHGEIDAMLGKVDDRSFWPTPS